MIEIFTQYDRANLKYPGVTIVDDNDAFFEEEEDGETRIDDKDFELMRKIDHIKFTDGLRSARSPFGPVSMFDLSTGCKTAINLNHCIRDKKRVIINITGCGEAAVYECFKLAEDEDIPLVLQHGYVVNIPDDFVFAVDGETFTMDLDVLSNLVVWGVEW